MFPHLGFWATGSQSFPDTACHSHQYARNAAVVCISGAGSLTDALRRQASVLGLQAERGPLVGFGKSNEKGGAV